MINVIRHGKREKEVQISVYRIVCSNCDCEFEFTRDDAVSLVKGMNLDEHARLGTITCPDCGYKNTFSLNDMCRTETLLQQIPMYYKEN